RDATAHSCRTVGHCQPARHARRQVEEQRALAETRIAIEHGQLAEGNPTRPQPARRGGLYLVQDDNSRSALRVCRKFWWRRRNALRATWRRWRLACLAGQ